MIFAFSVADVFCVFSLRKFATAESAIDWQLPIPLVVRVIAKHEGRITHRYREGHRLTATKVAKSPQKVTVTRQTACNAR